MKYRLVTTMTLCSVALITACSTTPSSPEATGASISETTSALPTNDSLNKSDSTGASSNGTEESSKNGPVEAISSIEVGPLIGGNVDGNGEFVSSLDDFVLVEEATAYKYSLDCDRFRWHNWSEDQLTHSVAYANPAALDSLRAAATEAAGTIFKVSCSPIDVVTSATSGETVEFTLTADPDAKNSLGKRANGSFDEEVAAANLDCEVVDNSSEAVPISFEYCATTRGGNVIVTGVHQPIGADLGWLAGMVNAYADNDSQVQTFINKNR